VSLSTIRHPGPETPLRDASFSTAKTQPPQTVRSQSVLNDPLITEGLAKVRDIMLGSVSEAAPFIRESLSSMIDSGGKMLRPALVLMAGWYTEEHTQSLYTLAAAVEMLHTATLVHDDIIDEAAARRGQPALHVTAGAKAAVLVGDYLFARCFGLMDEAVEKDKGLNAARVVERICEGEINQNSLRYSLNTGMREYRRRICAKTAALIAASLTLGAQHSNCGEEETMRFRRIGYDLGMGFQIIDDLLDFEGRRGETGKPVARDLEAGIFTAPVIHTLGSASGNELRKLLSRPPYGTDELKKAVDIIRASGGIDAARQMAADYTAHAEAEIAALRPGKSRDLLEGLASELLLRRR
jgi:geranylgeranyl pyrophosphate synthase